MRTMRDIRNFWTVKKNCATEVKISHSKLFLLGNKNKPQTRQIWRPSSLRRVNFNKSLEVTNRKVGGFLPQHYSSRKVAKDPFLVILESSGVFGNFCCFWEFLALSTCPVQIFWWIIGSGFTGGCGKHFAWRIKSVKCHFCLFWKFLVSKTLQRRAFKIFHQTFLV